MVAKGFHVLGSEIELCHWYFLRIDTSHGILYNQRKNERQGKKMRNLVTANNSQYFGVAVRGFMVLWSKHTGYYRVLILLCGHSFGLFKR